LTAAVFTTEPSTGFERRALENGLEVFVVENHIMPLARIQITFRCGAIAQRDGGMVSFSTCLQVLKANPPSLAPTCLDAG
jgi:hypothetical protein